MNSTQRFSNRVQDYVKYRPSYPTEIIAHLTRTGILTPSSIIADIGSGTGLLTELFLGNGNRVFGVEPNADMRGAGEQQLASFPNFTSIPATAEETTLAAASIDLITAGQAFHWFDRPRARIEFQRIGRPAGYVALIWNERMASTPFLLAYEELLRRFATDYAAVDHRQMTNDLIAAFYQPHPVVCTTFSNRQIFDFPGLKGRLLSSSYAPPAGHADHAAMLAALQSIFDTYQSQNQVTFEYQTQLYTGQL